MFGTSLVCWAFRLAGKAVIFPLWAGGPAGPGLEAAWDGGPAGPGLEAAGLFFSTKEGN